MRPSRPARTPARDGFRNNANLEAVSTLQVANDAEEPVCMRIAPFAQHARQAFWRRANFFAQLAETHGRVDIVAQHPLADFKLAVVHALDGLGQIRGAEGTVAVQVGQSQSSRPRRLRILVSEESRPGVVSRAI
jgi:hypothetical protein